MKNNFKFLFCLLVGFKIMNSCSGQTPSFVTIKGRQFYDKGGNPFYPLMCNLALEVAFQSTTDYYFAPHPQNGADETFECTDSPGCFSIIEDEFSRIKNMGFNCVRIAGSAPVYDAVLKKFYFHGWYNTTSGGPAKAYIDDLSNPTDPALSVYFDFLSNVNSLARRLDMYFMIDICPVYPIPENGDQVGTDNFNQLLDATGTYISGHNFENLFCYALVQEPIYTDPGYHTKSQVCNWVTDGYNRLKHADNNQHLITIGSLDSQELNEWDLSILKIDFLQVHVYSDILDYEGTTHFSNGLNRILGRLYWLKNYCPLPWMIGETGYSCKTGYTFPNVHGSETEQYNYVQQTMDYARDCGSSGYSWWFYQETNWLPYEDGFGLLYMHHLATESPSSLTEKPAVSLFRSYFSGHLSTVLEPPVALEPPNYYDPYTHHSLHPLDQNAVEGYIKDVNGNGIKDAVVQGVNWIQTTIPANVTNIDLYNYKYNVIYTFSEANGHFKIIPYSPTDESNSTIVEIEGSGIGMERFQKGQDWNGNLNPDQNGNPTGSWYPNQMATNVGNITLNRSTLHYDETLLPTTVGLNQVVEKKAWNSITFNPVTVVGNNVIGGTLTARARNDIHVQGESRFKSGSSVHLYLEDVFSDCMDFSPFHLVTKIRHPLLASDEVNHFIEIKFKKKNEINSNFQITPNPATTSITVVLKSPMTKNSILELLTPEGQILQSINITEQSTAIDISALPKGIYLVACHSQTLTETLKLIVQ